MFEKFVPGSPDPMYSLKTKADSDLSGDKIDVGVGIYRNEKGTYHELNAIKEAKQVLGSLNLGHDYELTVGNADFLRVAAEVVLGKDCRSLLEGKVASVQTISGTGANHVAALLIASSGQPKPRVYVGTPTWSITAAIFHAVGLETQEYSYLDSTRRNIDLEGILSVIKSAPDGSVFTMQGCCHNPTGIDPTLEQWRAIGQSLKAKNHVAVLDTAYQGLGDGLEEDAIAVRAFAELGLEVLACQSFSKNFALYGERCGALHAVTRAPEVAANVQDRLRGLIRVEYSSSPAYGARLVKIVLTDEEKRRIWLEELAEIRARLHQNRALLHRELTLLSKVPQKWDHILSDKGLFSRLDLSPSQCVELIDSHHVYLPQNGRINMAGLNACNVRKMASSILSVKGELAGKAVTERIGGLEAAVKVR